MSRRKQRKYDRADTNWTVNDVRAILHNPIYAGLGPFPAIVDERTWVGAQKQLIREDGLETVLRQMRAKLLETFGAVPPLMDRPGWVDVAMESAAQQGAEAYLMQLLGHLREAYHDIT